MILPSIYITDEFGQPVSGLTISDIEVYWINLITGEKNSIEGIDLIEDPDIVGLYRISDFPNEENNEYSEVAVVYQGRLIATLLRSSGTKPIGNIPVIITIQDLKGNKLSGVEAVLTDEDNNTILTGLLSDNSGKIYLSLNAGSYALYCHRIRTLFNNPKVFVVSEPITNVLIEANVVEIILPSPNKVVLYGYVYDLQGKPVEKANICVKVKPPFPQKVKDIMLSVFVSSTFTDKNGYFEISLLGGTEIQVEIPAIGMKKTCVLPQSGVINIAEI